MINMYKYLNKIYDTDTCILPLEQSDRTGGHQMMLKKTHTYTNTRHFFYPTSNRTVEQAPERSYRCSIGKRLQESLGPPFENHPVKFNYKALDNSVSHRWWSPKEERLVCMYVCVYVCMYVWLTHTGVEIDTCAFQTGCQLSSAALVMSMELCFFTQFQWREAYVLDNCNWQLAELPQSGGREFDPRRVHDNLSVPLWVFMRFPVPGHQN